MIKNIKYKAMKKFTYPIFGSALLMLAVTIMSATTTHAQEQPSLRTRAERLYNTYQYSRAADIYAQLVDVNKPKLQDLEQLASCYRKMNAYEKAENWYTRIIEDKASKAENLLAYGEVLKANSRYAEAKAILERYRKETGDVKTVAVAIAGCDSALVWLAHPTLHKLENEANINTEMSEFSAIKRGNQVYFTAEPNQTSSRIYGWTGNPFLKIFTAAGDNNNQLQDVKLVSADFNQSDYHAGPVWSNKAGDVLYVTRTHPGKKGEVAIEKGKKYLTHTLELDIYKNEGGVWQKPRSFAYNNVNAYSLGHATLSPDEKTLYYVSDMPGGMGGTDIWYSQLQTDGSWSAPQNAGPGVNTAGNEMFPVLAEDGTLYYSTDGLPGMGGLDVFKSKGGLSNWTPAVNLRYPLNSAGDDFSYYLNEGGTQGYLSSNRKGGKGADDIYSVSYAPSPLILALKGINYNKKTKEELAGVSVTLAAGHRLISKKSSDGKGRFFFELEKGLNYKVLGTKAGFYSDSAGVSTVGINHSDTLFVALNLHPLLEVGKTIALENIFYNFDKDDIRPDAAAVLDELVRTMRDNPTLEIELASHTDSRGSDSYNDDLSQRRAQSAVNYLVKQGISRSRMKAKGYGETQLLNACKNGVPCSREEHQANRRTAFTVLAH